MPTMILILIAVMIVFLFIEYRIHARRLRAIPLRIHVNGSRGKSSVTRLIAGALREHGLRTYAKTTGTLPRMITADGGEYPVYRPSGANIIEQLRIIALAAQNRAQVLVVECMALQPMLQSITELKMIRATHGVITNARPDHMEIMGPTERDVVYAMLGSVPVNGDLFTAESDYPEEFRKICADRKSRLHTVGPEDIDAVSDEDMRGFSYVEHKENVALVLKICQALGVERETAMRGMHGAKPDPGAMSSFEIEFFGRRILFINGFAANDPESSERIWRMGIAQSRDYGKKIMILNTRADRPYRSEQLGQGIVNWPEADRYVLVGSGVYILFRKAVNSGMEASRFIYAEDMTAERVFEEVVGASGESAMVMGIGNIGGPGLEIVKYFRNRSVLL